MLVALNLELNDPLETFIKVFQLTSIFPNAQSVLIILMSFRTPILT